MCKQSLIVVIVSFMFIMSFSGTETEGKALAYRAQKLLCVGNLHRACNYLGSYCHAEVLSGRKKRSVMSAEPGYGGEVVSRSKAKRRRVKIKVRLTGKCKLCAHYCW